MSRNKPRRGPLDSAWSQPPENAPRLKVRARACCAAVRVSRALLQRVGELNVAGGAPRVGTLVVAVAREVVEVEEVLQVVVHLHIIMIIIIMDVVHIIQ